MFNRLSTSDIYLEKYLPYNNFVQYCEILHVALEKPQLKKLEDYEAAKYQNYLAEILLDMGRADLKFDKKKTKVPTHDCECSGLSDFRQILSKQVKLTDRSSKVLRKVQGRRRHEGGR